MKPSRRKLCWMLLAVPCLGLGRSRILRAKPADPSWRPPKQPQDPEPPVVRPPPPVQDFLSDDLEERRVVWLLDDSKSQPIVVQLRWLAANSKTTRKALTLHGNGRVTLVTHRPHKPPRVAHGQIAPEVMRSLFACWDDKSFAANNLLFMDLERPRVRARLTRILTFRSPKFSSRMVVRYKSFADFEHIYGTLMFAAADAVPTVLRRRFFPRL